jgi:hypothetical protein
MREFTIIYLDAKSKRRVTTLQAVSEEDAFQRFKDNPLHGDDLIMHIHPTVEEDVP